MLYLALFAPRRKVGVKARVGAYARFKKTPLSYLDRFVVVPVHVADQEIEDRHVHQVEKPAAFVVRPDLSHNITVVLKTVTEWRG
jgi:hypothetical protein